MHYRQLFTPFTQIGSAALLSRLLGFVRDVVIAQLFGANAHTDAFFIAFKLPNLLRRLFSEGAFAVTLVPLLTHCRATQDHTAVRLLIARLTGSALISLALITLIGLIAAPIIIFLLAPGMALDATRGPLAIQLFYLTCPYLFFLGLTALAAAVLNTYNQFAIPALTPVLLNISLILCAIVLAPHLAQPIVALAWGVLLAGIAQLALQLPALVRLGLLSRPQFHWHDHTVHTTLQQIMPALLGVSAHQLNLLLAGVWASALMSGSISWLYYAERLLEFPLGILGSALGTAIVPVLARAHVQSDNADFGGTIEYALRWVLLLGLPATAGLCVLATPIMALLFQSAQFDAHAVIMAADALMAYALGVVPLMAIKVLAPAYYSRGDGRTPLRIALLTLGCSALFSALLIIPLGHVGLALATVIAALLNAGLLLRALFQTRVVVFSAAWRWFNWRIGTATAVMLLWLWWLLPPPAAWLAVNKTTGAGWLFGLIATGALLYGVSLLLLGVRPRQLWRQ